MTARDESLTPVLGFRRSPGKVPPAPHLYVAFDCDRPRAPSGRHCLADVDQIELRRSSAREAGREVREGQRVLGLGIADPWLSGLHAVIRREGPDFILEDKGSTNGTLVNGLPCLRATLRDGDVVEVGRTLLLFRAEVPRTARGAPDLLAAEEVPEAPAFATLHAPLAAEVARWPVIARSAVPVIIGGESGTGKELVARALHRLSGRPGPFVAVNCGALSRTLIEGELFGHRKGAFSGADEDRPGLLRSADRGTLFLDEVAELPPSAQAALLRVLQEGEVLAVGATRPVKVDLRVLAATHVDLESAVDGGRFRGDLLARLSGFFVRLPPLRERREDLGPLVASILGRLDPERACAHAFTAEAARALFRHAWPLNVRELEKALASAVALSAGAPIDLCHLPASLGDDAAADDEAPPLPAADPSLTDEENRRRWELSALLREHGGNVSEVARALGKARMQVQRWMKRYGLEAAAYRA